MDDEFRLRINLKRLNGDRYEAVADLLAGVAERVRNGKDGRGIWQADGDSEVRVGDFGYYDSRDTLSVMEFVRVTLHMGHLNAALEVLHQCSGVAMRDGQHYEEFQLTQAAKSIAEALEEAGFLDSRHLNPVVRLWVSDLAKERRATQKAADDGDYS